MGAAILKTLSHDQISIFNTENYNLPFTGKSAPEWFLSYVFNCEVMMSFTHSLVLDSDNQDFKTSITSLNFGRFS